MSDDTPWGSPGPGDAPKEDAPTASDALQEARDAWSTTAAFIKNEVAESAEAAQKTVGDAAQKVKAATKNRQSRLRVATRERRVLKRCV